MYKRPGVLAVDIHSKELLPNRSLERELKDLGQNTGNLLFSESLYGVLKNAKRLTYHLKDDDLDDCDVVVIAAANWINPFDDFGFIADAIEKSNLPVIICGIGSQLKISDQLPQLQPGTEKLLWMASRSSESISVRGEGSCEVLKGYGITNVDATGCPSLLMLGEEGPQLKNLEILNSSDIVLHSTRHLCMAAEDSINTFLYKAAINIDSDILFQSELQDMLMLKDESFDNNMQHASVNDYDLKHSFVKFYGKEFPEVEKYVKNHGHVFFNLSDWLHYMTTKKFSLGTRVHGSIASIIAGTKSILIAHDNRTEELALKMGLPYMLASDVDQSNSFDINHIIRTVASEYSNTTYQKYRNHYKNFFERVGLEFNSEFKFSIK
jgi:hypothetical protein